ncbi:ATP-binding protein [Gimesia panareensis]|uniref:ATP-binding protein n=1 Tax=Gimesia panareensis TaxID=2527978 RepID=UPI0011881BFB|nr:ATP-binding protein [Gimesia panareensis]QDU52948.1 hypothetical protein Pan110_53300 [Gimesia panareensis]
MTKISHKNPNLIDREEQRILLDENLRRFGCCHIVGASGIGKTTFVKSLIYHPPNTKHRRNIAFIDLNEGTPLTEKTILEKVFSQWGGANQQIENLSLNSLKTNEEYIVCFDHFNKENVNNHILPASFHSCIGALIEKKIKIISIGRQPLNQVSNSSSPSPLILRPFPLLRLSAPSLHELEKHLKKEFSNSFGPRLDTAINDILASSGNSPWRFRICSFIEALRDIYMTRFFDEFRNTSSTSDMEFCVILDTVPGLSPLSVKVLFDKSLEPKRDVIASYSIQMNKEGKTVRLMFPKLWHDSDENLRSIVFAVNFFDAIWGAQKTFKNEIEQDFETLTVKKICLATRESQPYRGIDDNYQRISLSLRHFFVPLSALEQTCLGSGTSLSDLYSEISRSPVSAMSMIENIAELTSKNAPLDRATIQERILEFLLGPDYSRWVSGR